MTPSRLSALIASLVGETAEGVRESSVAAARRRASLADSLGSDPTAGDVDDALVSLFPPLHKPPVDLLSRVLDGEALDEYVSGWRPGRTSVRAGEVYLHPAQVEAGDTTPRVAEFPPIERELGVSVLETVERGEGVGRLTETSVALVRRAVRDRLEAERHSVAAAFVGGVPTPVVESATVEVKVAFGGDDGRIEATLLDGRDGAARPELVGSISADLRFVAVPDVNSGGDRERTGTDADPDGGSVRHGGDRIGDSPSDGRLDAGRPLRDGRPSSRAPERPERGEENGPPNGGRR